MKRSTPPGLHNDPAAVDELLTARQDIQSLRARLAMSTRAATASQKQADVGQLIKSRVEELLGVLPEPAAWASERPLPTRSGIPMVMWSDWHYGETVSLAEMNGLNEFNTEIAEERIRRLTDRTIELCFKHMVAPKYPKIVVCLGGDMISGDIHEELRDTNDGYTLQHINQLVDTLSGALLKLAEAFNKVEVHCVVGNHGRNTLKPRSKGIVYTSYEWLLYRMLAKFLGPDPRFSFDVPESADTLFQVYDHRFLLTHGDRLGTKGGDGMIGALGPITRGTIKIGRAESQVKRDFDTVIMGHWHTYMPRSHAVSAIVNGALKGYDEYARLQLRAPFGPPVQALWFVHEKYGITAQWPVFL